MPAVARGTNERPTPVPAVSVLMSVYNGERFLAEAVESILGQSFADFEFLIVDDGSTDRTAEILRSYDDPRIRLIENPQNLGLTRSLNIGLEAARGGFIARMDADDIALPDRIARQLAFFDAHPAVVLAGSGHARLDDDVQTRTRATRALRPVEFRWLTFFWPPILHPSAMFRARLIRDRGLRYDEGLTTGQDYDLWTRMLAHGDGVCLDGPLVLWRRHGGAVGMTRRDDQIANHKRIASTYFVRQFPDLAPHREAFERLVEIHLQPPATPPQWREISACLTVADLLLDRLLAEGAGAIPWMDRIALLNRARITLFSLILRNGKAAQRPLLALHFLFRVRRFLLPSLAAKLSRPHKRPLSVCQRARASALGVTLTTEDWFGRHLSRGIQGEQQGSSLYAAKHAKAAAEVSGGRDGASRPRVGAMVGRQVRFVGRDVMTEADQGRKAQAYDTAFYDDRRQNTLYAARRILEILNRAKPIRSVVDFGCGSATWLSVARDLGADRVLGIEGGWVDGSNLDIPRENLMTWELEQPVNVDARFDLAISLEVAEHLSAGRAASFVEDICRTADLVLFSAAIPGQGGKLHINEQWQSYWAGKFADRGYRPIDLVRPSIWNDDRIPYWYRQNILVYATGDADTGIAAGLPDERSGADVQLDLVHPDLYGQYAPYNVKRALRGVARMPGHVLNKLRGQI